MIQVDKNTSQHDNVYLRIIIQRCSITIYYLKLLIAVQIRLVTNNYNDDIIKSYLRRTESYDTHVCRSDKVWSQTCTMSLTKLISPSPSGNNCKREYISCSKRDALFSGFSQITNISSTAERILLVIIKRACAVCLSVPEVSGSISRER